MFLRMIVIGILVILFGVLGTLGFVNTKKASDLNKEVVLVKKELKEHEDELHKLKEEFEALEKKSHGGAHAGNHERTGGDTANLRNSHKPCKRPPRTVRERVLL